MRGSFSSNVCEELIFNFALYLCFIFIGVSFSLEPPPSVSINVASKSSNTNLTYNIGLSLPIGDMMNYMIKRASLTSASGLPSILHHSSSPSSTVTKEGLSCKNNEDCHSSFLSCINRLCHCKNGTFLRLGVCLSIDEINCETNIDCFDNVTDMVCKQGRCICANGYVFIQSPEKSHGHCVPYAKHGSKCEWNDQCRVEDENMICRTGYCDCHPSFIYLNNERCYKKAKKMYDSCELDGQCFDISARAICSKNQICICQYGYYDNSWTCVHQEEAERSKAQQVYRTAMIAAACFMILVVSIFVICIVKKSFCGNTTSRSAIPGWQFRSGNETQGRASTNEEEITVADKPPSYEEVMLTPCTPPPNYTDILKLFPITEGLLRHNSEPRLSAMTELGSSRNRANSFHTCEDSVLPSNDTESTNQQPITPPPQYEPPSGRSRPSLHLDIPVITVSFSPEIEDAPLNNENTTQSHGRYS